MLQRFEQQAVRLIQVHLRGVDIELAQKLLERMAIHLIGRRYKKEERRGALASSERSDVAADLCSDFPPR